MDKIWYRNPIEVGDHWPLWRGWKNEWPHRMDKSRTLKKLIKNTCIGLVLDAFVDKYI